MAQNLKMYICVFVSCLCYFRESPILGKTYLNCTWLCMKVLLCTYKFSLCQITTASIKISWGQYKNTSPQSTAKASTLRNSSSQKGCFDNLSQYVALSFEVMLTKEKEKKLTVEINEGGFFHLINIKKTSLMCYKLGLQHYNSEASWYNLLPHQTHLWYSYSPSNNGWFPKFTQIHKHKHITTLISIWVHVPQIY